LACQEEIKLHRCSPEPNKGGKREKKNQHSAHSNKPLVTKQKKKEKLNFRKINKRILI
jgi:hypothetical protein